MNEIDLYVSDRYIRGTFDSCKNVQFPSTGQLSLDLMCGSWGAAKCTADRWYSFMSDVSEDFVPFQINYKTENTEAVMKGFTQLNPRIVQCNESIDVRNFTSYLFMFVHDKLNRGLRQHAHAWIALHRVLNHLLLKSSGRRLIFGVLIELLFLCYLCLSLEVSLL